MRMILASSSPRRRELLSIIGIEPQVLVPAADETTRPGETTAEFVRRVTLEKGRSVYRDEFYEIPVVSSDTIVTINGQILGKPVDRRDAGRMLGMLSGAVHEVWTGVGILYRGQSYYDIARTKVYFARLSPEEIDFYLDHESYRDKAGAYGIQEKASVFVEKIEGCYFNVVGFPLNLFYRMLKKIGIELYARVGEVTASPPL